MSRSNHVSPSLQSPLRALTFHPGSCEDLPPARLLPALPPMQFILKDMLPKVSLFNAASRHTLLKSPPLAPIALKVNAEVRAVSYKALLGVAPAPLTSLLPSCPPAHILPTGALDLATCAPALICSC